MEDLYGLQLQLKKLESKAVFLALVISTPLKGNHPQQSGANLFLVFFYSWYWKEVDVNHWS